MSNVLLLSQKPLYKFVQWMSQLKIKQGKTSFAQPAAVKLQMKAMQDVFNAQNLINAFNAYQPAGNLEIILVSTHS